MTADSIDLTALPDFPALGQLAKALWREPGERGAAVLVGAGFSLNAVLKGADVRPPPLWRQLVEGMKAAMYANGADAPADALRVAEEYRTYFGQAALNDYVRASMPDAGWSPGALHRDLLELPWADVLTTNFDTLLERAGDELLKRSYQVVRTDGDLARFSAPRIVKLHGTIGVDDNLILAEEDFRTYPASHAAFVNMARQAFIENELCLFGFSGDDPNFLAWSGWVRDHLAGNARRIYLVGVLNLSPAKRKLLEARNISPIDLGPAVNALDRGERDREALKAVLDFLAASEPDRPYDWLPASSGGHLDPDYDQVRKDPDRAAGKFVTATAVWANDRQSYPGWLVAPGRVRHELRWGMDSLPALTEAVREALGPQRLAATLREMAWRHWVGYLALEPGLAAVLADTLESKEHGLDKAGIVEVALVLLRHARQTGDIDQFAQWASMIEANADPEGDAIVQVAYQRCLRARDALDNAGVEAIVEAIDGPDPAWRLRRAGLLAELGRIEAAQVLVTEALADLRSRQRTAPSSVWIMSRLAWAEWFASALTSDTDFSRITFSHRYREWRTDPDQLMEGIVTEARRQSRKRRQEARKVIPGFEEGHYKDPGKTISFVNRAGSTPFYEIQRLLEESGLPLRLRHYALAVEPFMDAVELEDDGGVESALNFLRGVGRTGDSRFGDRWSRGAIARMPDDVARQLLSRLYPAIEFWQARWKEPDRFKTALDVLPLYVETAARLVLRAPPADAISGFRIALSLAHDAGLRHPMMSEPIGNLARNALRALPREARPGFALDILDFPMPGERGGSAHRWPDPSDWLRLMDVSQAPSPPGWDTRVQTLIEAVRTDTKARGPACSILTHLAAAGRLTPSQLERFGVALWQRVDDIDPPLPANTHLYAFVFARLPHPPEIDAEARVRHRLFENLAPIGDSSILDGLAAAAAPGNDGGPIGPSPRQARHLFDGFMDWKPKVLTTVSERVSAAFSGESDERTARTLGHALSFAVCPWLSMADRTPDRLSRLFAFLEIGGSGFGLSSLVWFVGGGDDAVIIERLRRGLLSRDFDQVAGSAEAIQTWLRNADRFGSPPELLVKQLILLFEIGQSAGLHIIARALRKLATLNRLDASDLGRLRIGLGRQFAETDYDAVELGGSAEVSVTLVRAECVRLSVALERIGAAGAETTDWIVAAKCDPLPEVRDALAAELRKSKDASDQNLEAG